MAQPKDICIWNGCERTAYRTGWFCSHHMNSVGDAPDIVTSVQQAASGIGIAQTARLLLAAMEQVYRIGSYVTRDAAPDNVLANELASVLERDAGLGLAAVLDSISAGTLAERGLGAVFATKALEHGSKPAVDDEDY